MMEVSAAWSQCDVAVVSLGHISWPDASIFAPLACCSSVTYGGETNNLSLCSFQATARSRIEDPEMIVEQCRVLQN